jgi:hypothetical protein
MTWNRPQKNEVRKNVVGTGMRPATSLWLPGDQCLCLHEALGEGFIDQASKLVLVERDRVAAQQIRSWAETAVMWKVPPILLEKELHDVKLPFNIDFAYIDLMGTLLPKICLWIIEELAPKLNTGASICLVHTYGWRNAEFLYFMNDHLKWCSRYQQLQVGMRTNDKYNVLPIALLSCCLRELSFDVTCTARYGDSVRTMVYYKLENIRSGPTEWPYIEKMIKRYLESPTDHNPFYQRKDMSKKNSERARKAWVTRRAMERSRRAYKAWETRRKQAQTA